MSNETNAYSHCRQCIHIHNWVGVLSFIHRNVAIPKKHLSITVVSSGFFIVILPNRLQVFHSVCFLRHSAVICVSRFQAAHSNFAHDYLSTI